MIVGDKTCYEHILKTNLTFVQSCDEVILLGVVTDKSLDFQKHIDNFVRKTWYKLHALQRIRKFLNVEKAKKLGNAFIDSKFNYAILVWMFYRKRFTLKLKKCNIRLGIDDSYNIFLLRSEYVSVHRKFLQFLVREIFKGVSQINPEFTWSFFKQKKSSYNLRKGSILNVPRTQSTN